MAFFSNGLAARMPDARYESARQVKGQALLLSLFVGAWGGRKLRRADTDERRFSVLSLVISMNRSFVRE